jgi:chromosomal replication initiation ATPase DnaA
MEHSSGRPKASFFLGLGFLQGEPAMLSEALRRHATENGIAQTFKGDKAFADAVLQKVEVPELIRRSLRVDQTARAVAEHLEPDLSSLRTPRRTAVASRARAMTAYLGKLCGWIPYARTPAFFNRDGSSIARDVLALDRSHRDSKKLRDEIESLARGLVRSSTA